MEELSIKVIGIGGVGTIFCDKLLRFLNYGNTPSNVTLVDGDIFEQKNLPRQDFSDDGNKAVSKTVSLRSKYDKVRITPKDCYVDQNNISSIMGENDIVCVCVDNHKTRKVISDYAFKLKNVVVISGGNELTDGNVQIFVRREGENLTPSLTDYHPEISEPKDKLPTEMSCEELSSSEPQLFFTNLGVATFMCFAFYNVITRKDHKYSEVYFDIEQMKADSKIRKPIG